MHLEFVLVKQKASIYLSFLNSKHFSVEIPLNVGCFSSLRIISTRLGIHLK